MENLKLSAYMPTPMPTTDSFMKSFDTTVGDPDEKVQKALEKEYKFGYRSGIGEIIYAMVTARPDVSPHVVRVLNTVLAQLHHITTQYVTS
jgi:hypothetical protein